mmetsp:Transcript_12744/g.15115  ORF Transcript_12744/g.15115 Transcript_12744/m.15115 type:complete len:387 (-) Transcript_12744:126-1286(-)|eukprot:jgi/Bigna1/89755/estExt_fgenesh1_pg.C_550023
MSVNLVALSGLKNEEGRSERDSKVHQEMLRFNRWKRTVNKIEALGGIPKINLDNLDRNQNLFHGTSLSGRNSLFSQQGSERAASRLKRAPKLNQKQLPQKRSQAQEQTMQAHEFKRFLSVEHDVLDSSMKMRSTKSINGEIPSFRRVSSFVGTAEGFELFEESALFGKSAGSFERTEGLMNPSSGSLEPRQKVMFQKVNSFSSVKSGDDGSLFDFSTVNTDQKNLILGALPLMPKKPKPAKGKEESQKSESDKNDGGSGDDGKSKHKNDSNKEEQGDDSTSTPSKSESGSGKDTGNSKTRSDKDECSKREKVAAKEEVKDQNKIGPLEDEDGNVREYTKIEKKIILQRYKEKKRKRSFKKVIRYECRRKFAVSRPRIGGRFVKLKK